ncbi:MAG: ZIP family metal transporter, partial [Candidatus Aenigmarchaeota archaeon]|nr:ZIP family metal transporter [Candidatus Aenigmarchaeota archaeon]
ECLQQECCACCVRYCNKNGKVHSMITLAWILLSTFLVSIISFIGILTFVIKERLLERLLLILVSLAAGALMGGAFLHLIPEALEAGSTIIFIYLLVGFGLFFLIEKVLHWRHCHEENCPVHTFAYMSLIGDGVHNFIDGLIIAASFLADFNLGIATTFAVAMHEIPQELGDYGVLIHGGFKKMRALFMNFVSAVTAIAGGIIGYFIAGYSTSFLMFVLPFAAGGFIYIAASDLIPEIKKEAGLKKSLLNFSVFVLGVLIIYALKFVG